MTPRTIHWTRLFPLWAVLTLGLSVWVGLDLIPHLDSVFTDRVSSAGEVDMAGKVLSDLSRVLGVTLSMLAVLCALAVPLTANVYTPKLVEIFVTDRKNQLALGFYVTALAVILWNKFVINTVGPPDTKLRVFACLLLTLVGLVGIVPYFYYVFQFLVPRSIIRRLEGRIQDSILRGAKVHDEEAFHALVQETVRNVQYLGKITMRSVDRYDRDSADEGLQALSEVFGSYLAHKPYWPHDRFHSRFGELRRMGPELAQEVERKCVVIEVAILQELGLILALSMSRLPEIVALIAVATRRFGVRANEAKDEAVREMVTLHFNTFLRQALKGRQADAFYKFSYQYRRFAESLLDSDPSQSCRIAFFMDYYGHQAVRMGLGFLINVVAYDLSALCAEAYRRRSPARRSLVRTLANLDRDEATLLDMPGVVKAQILLAAKLLTHDEAGAAQLLRVELQKVSDRKLREAFAQILSAREENFWEIADRRRHLDHVDLKYRPAVDQLRRELVGDVALGVDTMLFLRDERPDELSTATVAPRPSPGGGVAGEIAETDGPGS